MKENKVFKSVYGAVLVIFIISSVMLGSRLAKLHRGNEFYRQIGGGRGFSSAVFLILFHQAGRMRPKAQR